MHILLEESGDPRILALFLVPFGSLDISGADETVPVAASRIVAGIGSGSPGTVMRANAANVHTSTARAGGQLAEVCSAPNAVPQDATAVGTPARCIAITSV